jgi:hypothetical protein
MSSLDFLLECIGFPPDTNSADLVQRVLAEGEGVPGRGDPAFHRRLVVGEGLELRLDREDDQEFWTLLPHYRVPHRLRVAVESLRSVEDSPFDALLIGWAAPPTPQELAELSGEQRPRAGAYRFATWLTDARRLPSEMNVGHVLAISVVLTAMLYKADEGSDVDDVARLAFGVAIGLMTALLIVGVAYPVDGLFASASLQVLALLVSYIAIYAEQRRGVHASGEAADEAGAAARVMALGAAHNSLLPRISGRRMNTADKGF